MNKTFEELLKFAKDNLFTSKQSLKNYKKFLELNSPDIPLEKTKKLGYNYNMNSLFYDFYAKINSDIESIHEEKAPEIIELLKEVRDKKISFPLLRDQFLNNKNVYNNLTGVEESFFEEPYFYTVSNISNYAFIVNQTHDFLTMFITKEKALQLVEYLEKFEDINYIVYQDIIKKLTPEQINQIESVETHKKFVELYNNFLKYDFNTKIFKIRVNHRKHVERFFPCFPGELYRDYKELFFTEDELVCVYLCSENILDLYMNVLSFFLKL